MFQTEMFCTCFSSRGWSGESLLWAEDRPILDVSLCSWLRKQVSLSLVLFSVGSKAPGLTLVPVQPLGWCGPAGHHITQPHIPHGNQQLSGPVSQLTRPSRTSTALTVEKKLFQPSLKALELCCCPKLEVSLSARDQRRRGGDGEGEANGRFWGFKRCFT